MFAPNFGLKWGALNGGVLDEVSTLVTQFVRPQRAPTSRSLGRRIWPEASGLQSMRIWRDASGVHPARIGSSSGLHNSEIPVRGEKIFIKTFPENELTRRSQRAARYLPESIVLYSLWHHSESSKFEYWLSIWNSVKTAILGNCDSVRGLRLLVTSLCRM